MVRKKLDNRIRTLIENCVATGHRSLFAVVGDKGRDQVVILHHILSKAIVSARPSVLWCYKKELGFSTHRKKRMKEVQKRLKAGKINVREDDPFELFIASTEIRYCYYAETHKILGNTFGMLILQDFEAITPNLLARTIETIQGGGSVVLLLRSVTSLRQLYTMAMDVHSRFRTASHSEIFPRFNERFILSLIDCRACVFTDDQLDILPISSHISKIEPINPSDKNEQTPEQKELKSLKDSMQDAQPIGVLLNLCKTTCQAKTVLRLLDEITEKTLKATCSITAARGRGKSAALGLAISGAIGFGYSNVFVTSPSPENLKTLFEFVIKGFTAMDYQEHMDYELLRSMDPEFNKAIIRINVTRDHRQTIQYVHPRDANNQLGQAELVVIDEAAAIPLPLVKQLFGPYLVFLSSTINGYEGTGRSLSLKLLQELREQAAGSLKNEKGQEKMIVAVGGKLAEQSAVFECHQCAQIADGDSASSTMPTASEAFLGRLMAIYVAAHYKNSPNDLQMLSDAPAHRLFVLMGPIDQNIGHLPEVLAVVQSSSHIEICFEGNISKAFFDDNLQRGKRAAGDLLAWTIAQQFQDSDFATLNGARIIRIAVHPDYQKMGYGSRALELLRQYYQGEMPCLNEEIETDIHIKTVQDENTVDLLEEKLGPRSDLPPLLLRLTEKRAESLDYLGAFGIN